MISSWVEIDYAVLRENIAALRAAVPARTDVIFVVKADAYGHGLSETVRVAAAAGVRWFGVAHLQEALTVRAAVPEAEILLMGVAPAADAGALVQHRITPMIVSEEHGRALAVAAAAAGGTIRGHLKVDTGMGRLGVLFDQAPATFAALRGVSGLALTGVCSHFATVEPDRPHNADQQAARFAVLAQEIEALAGGPLIKHLSSSRAILTRPEWDYDAVRPGICLYGYGAADPRLRFRTRPVLQWKAEVMQVKDVPAGFPIGYYGTHVTERATRIAVLSAGYTDGYPRALSNRGHVLIRGRRCPVIGRVSMNWITVDVGPRGDAAAGDVAVLIGEQLGAAVWAGELAKLCRTIPYEMLVGIDRQAERRQLAG
jgi:alanine racemase